jgi:hypothetical protein
VAAAIALVGLGVGLATLGGAFNRPAAKTELDAKPESPGNAGLDPAPAAYLPRDAEALFNGKSVFGWSGRGITIEDDDEKKPVLTAEAAARPIKARQNFRVVLALDCTRAGTVEVVIATGGDSPDAARWLVRMNAKSGVALGKQVKGGAFEPVAPPVPFPAAKKNQPPYLELKYERSGGALAAWFDSVPLGRAPDAGLKTTEFRVEATGGPVRIESAEFTQLVEKR